jgi:hypothetical protein
MRKMGYRDGAARLSASSGCEKADKMTGTIGKAKGVKTQLEKTAVEKAGGGLMRRWPVALILVCLLAVFLPALSHAQQERPIISGKVTDTKGRPIAAALINIPALNESVISDDQGAYRLVLRSKTRSGEEVVIRASRKGFDYTSRSLRLRPKARLRINFRLTPSR